ncbi:MaoC family dehydratase [Hoeflea prorocentri]|uniref:MaoC family dehydratase n=1 Tax=Hoeflea prorocentri TaxID=1922333 RepID=A0A9X3ZFV3_9HYPH|nr:MaoC family dehydratase [Hoeflea prorocentri]MCY6379544.1 MaoC family dehydratase [Hoeflea prorocentri]MDA5397344.1 MaoC family dehydratase [Hoeflea prorocentri]
MPSDRLAFEDFEPGRQFPLGPYPVSAEDIIAFASEFDPQPMHLDEEAGKASILGGLSASGWHTCAIIMRMFIDGYIGNSTSQGAPGVDSCKWLRPVLAGDTLSGTSTVVSARALQSKPGLGAVELRHEIVNQKGETVCTCENSGFFGLRSKEAGT